MNKLDAAVEALNEETLRAIREYTPQPITERMKEVLQSELLTSSIESTAFDVTASRDVKQVSNGMAYGIAMGIEIGRILTAAGGIQIEGEDKL